MTSTDGTTWTEIAAPEANQWCSVTYANGLFVAVSQSGNNKVMTSTDGTNWTLQSASINYGWTSVTYGNGVFVAVAYNGGVNGVMTSPDGINWTTQTTPVDNQWMTVTYGNGLFVALGRTATSDNVMTSTDGVNWSTNMVADNNWESVCYGAGFFIAVAPTGTGSHIIRSSNGTNWTDIASPYGDYWHSVAFGNNVFVITSGNNAENGVLVSSNCPRPTGAANQTFCYGASINDLVATGTAIQWYASANSTTPIPASTTLNDNTNYYATQTHGGCESVSRLVVNVGLTSATTAVTLDGLTLTAAQSNASYQWINCSNNQAIPGANSQSLTVTENGSYAVEITLNNCPFSSECKTIDYVGLKELTIGIDMYPNPTSEKLIIDAQETIESAQIMDVSGKIISNSILNSKTNEINVSNLQNGIYLIRINFIGSTTTKQFIKK